MEIAEFLAGNPTFVVLFIHLQWHLGWAREYDMN